MLVPGEYVDGRAGFSENVARASFDEAWKARGGDFGGFEEVEA